MARLARIVIPGVAHHLAAGRRAAAILGIKYSVPGIPTLLLTVTSPALAQDNTAATSDGTVALLIGVFTFIVVGAVIGWLAERLVGGSGAGFWGDVLFGIGGALLAGYVTTEMGIWAGEVIGGLIAAASGALALILAARLIRRVI